MPPIKHAHGGLAEQVPERPIGAARPPSLLEIVGNNDPAIAESVEVARREPLLREDQIEPIPADFAEFVEEADVDLLRKSGEFPDETG